MEESEVDHKIVPGKFVAVYIPKKKMSIVFLARSEMLVLFTRSWNVCHHQTSVEMNF